MAMSQDDLERLANNPQRGINLIVNEIENNWFDGTVKLNSKSHPAVLSMDLILGTSHGFLNRLGDAVSKVFLLHARNVSDMSRNMSDDERFGLFANPADCSLQFAISEASFMSIAKDYTATQGKSTLSFKKLLIPKDTVVDVNGYSFAVSNGVELRFGEKSGWQAVFDEETNNPFTPITTNLVEKDKKLVNGTVYRLFTIPVKQMDIKATENITSNEGSGCRGSITYPDYLYGVRAFLYKDGVLSEIGVTYDQDVFDPLSPTLALNIDTVNKRFEYEIPDVYIANKLGIGTVRIYTYTTKGAMTKDLRETPPTNIIPNYQDYRYGAGKLNEFSSPLRNAPGVAWAVTAVATGGEDPIPFNEMKRQLIEDRRSRMTPITESNLVGKVENYGYTAVKSIDFLTRRSYSVSKELPIQDNKGFYAPMSCYVGSHLASANDLIGAGVVLDNGARITIPHNVLFDISEPTAKLLGTIDRQQYAGLSSEALVAKMANVTLAYTPFYYVMDLSNHQAVLRTYHLDEPTINNQTFVAENSTLGFELGVGAMNIAHQDDGYVITIVTQSSDSYKQVDNDQVGVQLSINPQDSSSQASLRGTLVGLTEQKERIWQFTLKSKFDVDVNNIIYFTNFSQFGIVQPSTGTALDLEMTLIFTTLGDPEYTKTDSDAKIDTTLFDDDVVAVIETRYSITLGKQLGNLYSRIRPLVGEAQYQRYGIDIPETYPETVFKYENGQLVFDENGDMVVEHKAGDIAYNSDGKVRLLYSRGDVIYENGVPVELAPRDLKYHWDFIGFDGNYFFSTDTYDKDFAQFTKDYFVNVISKDMEAFTALALDRTNLLYQPRSKLGWQKVVVNSNYESFLKQDLSFTITYYLTASGFRNQNLKDALTQSTPKVLNTKIYGADTIGTANFTTALLENASSDVVSAKTNALSGDTTVDVISNLDSLTGFSIRKELKLSGDGGTTVKEAIDIIFLQHDASVSS